VSEKTRVLLGFVACVEGFQRGKKRENKSAKRDREKVGARRERLQARHWFFSFRP